MKTSLAASLLFHPAGHSLGKGAEPTGRAQDQTGVWWHCCASQCWLRGFIISSCRGAEPSWSQGWWDTGLAPCGKGWGRGAQDLQLQPSLSNFLFHSHFPNGCFRAFQKSWELSVVIVTDPCCWIGPEMPIWALEQTNSGSLDKKERETDLQMESCFLSMLDDLLRAWPWKGAWSLIICLLLLLFLINTRFNFLSWNRILQDPISFLVRPIVTCCFTNQHILSWETKQVFAKLKCRSVMISRTIRILTKLRKYYF